MNSMPSLTVAIVNLVHNAPGNVKDVTQKNPCPGRHYTVVYSSYEQDKVPRGLLPMKETQRLHYHLQFFVTVPRPPIRLTVIRVGLT